MQPPVGSQVPNDMVESSHLLALDQLISGLPALCVLLGERNKLLSCLSQLHFGGAFVTAAQSVPLLM